METIEETFGKLQGNFLKISKPGESFRVSLYGGGNRETFSKKGNLRGNRTETTSLKVLVIKVSEGNQTGNSQETNSFPRDNQEGYSSDYQLNDE